MLCIDTPPPSPPPSMSTNGSGASWLSLLDEKKHNIEESFGQGYSIRRDICTGRSFRSAFEVFSKKKGDHKFSRLEAKLFPSLTSITELAKVVGQSIADLQHLAPNDTLEALVWWTSFALIEVGSPFLRYLRSLPFDSVDAKLELNFLLL